MEQPERQDVPYRHQRVIGIIQRQQERPTRLEYAVQLLQAQSQLCVGSKMIQRGIGKDQIQPVGLDRQASCVGGDSPKIWISLPRRHQRCARQVHRQQMVRMPAKRLHHAGTNSLIKSIVLGDPFHALGGEPFCQELMVDRVAMATPQSVGAVAVPLRANGIPVFGFVAFHALTGEREFGSQRPLADRQ